MLTKRSIEEIKLHFNRNNKFVAKICGDRRFSNLYSDQIFSTLLTDSKEFYQQAVLKPDETA